MLWKMQDHLRNYIQHIQGQGRFSWVLCARAGCMADILLNPGEALATERMEMQAGLAFPASAAKLEARQVS